METLIIVFVVLSLLGSVFWAMPTRRQKEQGALRMKARNLGLQTRMERLTFPRAKGEVEEETRQLMAYRMLRDNIDRKAATQRPSWLICQADSMKNVDLPEGWSWKVGESELSESSLAYIENLVPNLPKGVLAIESSPLYVAFYWDERGGEAVLDTMAEQITALLKDKV
ncbi:MAG: hypothetical protein ACPGPF_04670 [Pontibacterium sp.]